MMAVPVRDACIAFFVPVDSVLRVADANPVVVVRDAFLRFVKHVPCDSPLEQIRRLPEGTGL